METRSHFTDGSKQLFYMSPEAAIAKASLRAPVKAYQVGMPERRVKSYSIEKTRTALGDSLPYEDAISRVSIKIENVVIDGVCAWGDVWTALDGGEFKNEGRYLLSTVLETIEPKVIAV